MATLKIRKGTGTSASKFLFQLIADNNIILSDGRPTYTSIDQVLDVAIKYFPNFCIVDETGVLKSTKRAIITPTDLQLINANGIKYVTRNADGTWPV